MNNNKYLENIEMKNRRLLLKIYNRHVAKLKYKIYLATENGNDTVYLERLRNEVEQEIALMQRNLQKYSAQSTKTSYNSGAKMAFVGVAAKELVSGYQFGGANREAMLVLAKTTYQPLSKMAQKIGRATLEYMKRENFKDTQTVLKALNQFVDSDFLRKAGIEGIADVAVGSSSWQKVAREIRDKIIKEGGLKVPYYKKDGTLARMVNAQDYAKMVARTTTSNIYREGAKDRILDTFDGEFDLVEILNHSEFPNSPCIPFEGKILSLTGVVEGYTTLDEAKAEGLFHPNCVHSFAFTDKVKKIYDKGDWEKGEKIVNSSELKKLEEKYSRNEVDTIVNTFKNDDFREELESTTAIYNIKTPEDALKYNMFFENNEKWLNGYRLALSAAEKYGYGEDEIKSSKPRLVAEVVKLYLTDKNKILDENYLDKVKNNDYNFTANFIKRQSRLKPWKKY